MLTVFTILTAVSIFVESPMPTSNVDSNVELQEKFSIKDDGNEIGFVNWNSYYSDPSVAGIYSLYLKPEFRNKGYGKQLMHHAIDVIAKRGYSSILLIPGAMEMRDGKLTDLSGQELEALLPQRLAFYRSLGFVTDPHSAKQLVYYIGKTKQPLPATPSIPSMPCSITVGIVTLIVLAIVVAWFWKRKKR